MENTNKKQFIILIILGLLLIAVISFTAYSVKNYRKEKESISQIKINQIYSSDYKLATLDDSYFIGSYKDKEIDVIIDKTGKEIFKTTNSIPYDNIIKTKDGKSLIYKIVNTTLYTYLFDKDKITEYKIINNIEYPRPLIYKGLEYDYIVGFYSNKDKDLNIYPIDTLEPITIKNSSLMPIIQKETMSYISNEKYLIVKNEESKMGVIDFTGKEIISSIYANITSTDNDTFVAKNDKDKYGLLNNKNEVILKFTNKVIKNYQNHYLIVNNNNKMAIYDKDLNNLTGYIMDYDPLLEYDLRETSSIYVSKLNGNVIIANNYQEDQNGTEYTKHNLYILKNNKIWKTIQEKGFFHDTYLYTYDKNYKVTVYDENYNEITTISLDSPSKIENISSPKEDLIKITYLNTSKEQKTKYYNKKGEETENPYLNYGEYIKNPLYNMYLKNNEENKTLTIFSLDYNTQNEISGTHILTNKDYIIVDNAIYKIELF